MSINQIVEGTVNNLFNKEEALFKERITKCRSCQLLAKDKIFGEVCNGSLYLNVHTNETSNKPKPGFVNGCGCVLRSKCRVPSAKCPLGR